MNIYATNVPDKGGTNPETLHEQIAFIFIAAFWKLIIPKHPWYYFALLDVNMEIF